MDYHFERELGSNKPLARISLEHEGLGEFLSDEIGEDEVKLVQLLRALRPEAPAQPEFSLMGRQWSLQITGDEVLLEPHHINQPPDQAAERLLEDDAIDSIDGAAACSCGTDDFYHLLQAWHAFVRQR